jgi:GTP cyclohydrolase I
MGDARVQRRLPRRRGRALNRGRKLRPAAAAKGSARTRLARASGRGAYEAQARLAKAKSAAPDRTAMASAIEAFLRAAGVPLSATDRARTPERVADAWADDLISGYASDPIAELTSEPVGGGGGLVVLRDIEFHSTCVHHLLPFYGRAHVAYLPDERLVGLSKVARAVDILARRLQVQERLTDAIVEALTRALRPAGVACVIEAEHLCVSCRGVRKTGVRVVTSQFKGALARSPHRGEVSLLLAPR